MWVLRLSKSNQPQQTPISTVCERTQNRQKGALHCPSLSGYIKFNINYNRYYLIHIIWSTVNIWMNTNYFFKYQINFFRVTWTNNIFNLFSRSYCYFSPEPWLYLALELFYASEYIAMSVIFYGIQGIKNFNLTKK